jgi:hypothetical protein
MQTRLYALALGVGFIALGILGFIPAFRTSVPASAPSLDVTESLGNLFSVFPVNAVSCAGYIAIGLIGVVASANLDRARYYCISTFLVFGILAIWGFIPLLDTLWRLAPIYGDDSWLHAGVALLAGYFGFVAPEPTYVEPAPGHAH